MKTTVAAIHSQDNSSLISFRNIVTDISDDFLELTGYSKIEIVDKDILKVFTNLLRLPQETFEQIDLKESIECYIFTKSLEVRETFISKLQGSKENERIYFIKEKPNSRLSEKFQYTEYPYKLNNIGVAIYQASNFVLLRANETFLNFIDEPYNRIESSIGKSLHEICPGWTGSESNYIWQKVVDTGEPYFDKENVFRGLSRGTTYWDVSIVPIFDDNKIKYLIETAIEVTQSVMDRKRIEEQYETIKKQQNELLNRQATLLNISNEAIFAWGPDGAIFYWNKGAEKMYGYSNEEAVGCVSEDLLKTVYPCKVHDIKAILANDGAWNGEIEHTTKHGKKLIIETINQVILNEFGQQVVLESNRDVTEQKKQQEQLLKAEKEKNEILARAIEMKDEFLSLISHEFKTPLTVINSAIQAMEAICRDELSNKAKGFLNKIRQNSNRQLKLVNNLLDLTRLNAGHLKVNNRDVDIVFLTRSITESIKIFAEQKGIKLSFSSSLGMKIIGIDEEKYERILLNLLSNAVKFTPEGKSITVMISQKIVNRKCKVCIQVKDKGVGIPYDKMELVFERFGQVDSSLTRQAEGTGIGLHLVKMLVELMGGEIALESKVGAGSTFTILLPIEKTKETPIKQMIKEITDNRLIQATVIEFSDIYLY